MKSKFFPILMVIVLFSALGCQSTVWTLLERGKTEEAKNKFLGEAGVNEQDRKGRTALHIAAEKKDGELARFLLAQRAKTEIKDLKGRTPLSISAELEDPEVGKILSEGGADIHHPMASGSTETIAVRALRSSPAFLSSILAGNPNAADLSGKTILHLAAREGSAGAVERILASGTSIDRRDFENKTALDYALLQTDSVRHAATAEKLILSGGRSDHPLFAVFAPPIRSSNYNIRLDDGNTALHYTAGNGYTGYLDFLIQKKAAVNIKNNAGSTPLHEAARGGQLETMRKLIAAGADANAQDAKGNTPLHLAVPPERHAGVIALLLSNNANPNIRDEHGEIPLQVTVSLNRPPQILEGLLERPRPPARSRSDISNRNIDGKTALYQAVEAGRLELIPVLLKYQADIFAADNRGTTPLEKALREKSPSLPLLLTAETVLKNDSAGNTPLHIAVLNGADPSVIEMILDRGGPVNVRNKEGNTALHTAVQLNDEASGVLLIDRGADIFAPNAGGESPLYLAFHNPGGVRLWMFGQKTAALSDGSGNTTLHYAAQWKLARHIPMLAAQGSPTEAANASGETALFMAAQADSPPTIQALADAGARLSARDFLGNSALHSAVRWNAPRAANTLITSGLSVNSQNLAGKSPLHEAVRLRLSSMETLLIGRGANIEIRDGEGNTPLMEAVMAGFLESEERLIDAGADPAVRNNQGDTPLHIAVDMRRPDLITPLLNNGAPIHARNSQGSTPFTAALAGSREMVSLLLTKDRITASDDDGLSPLHIALKERSDPAMIKTIIDRGGRISAVDKEGRTPLRFALDLGSTSGNPASLENARVLADSGSDVFFRAEDGKTAAEAALGGGSGAVRAVFSGRALNSRDSSGNTILHYAAQKGDPELIRLLLELGADKRIRNIESESPADIAQRWHNGEAVVLLVDSNGA
ncbi:MAG: ankyrin repeat domain-containing protein [Treponema sp.]|jgi:ankyrin repeat protein|nr:ankyrin repeat domain-containing protein [Treponema sp.]